MTVLEKIKRCVSLIWDFQELYDEEDIEDFCHNELRTYQQHDEIMEYFKHLEELEQQIAILGKRCNQLLKDKGDLTDRLSEEVELHLHAEDYIKSLEQQIEKMKMCCNCRHPINPLDETCTNCRDYNKWELRK